LALNLTALLPSGSIARAQGHCHFDRRAGAFCRFGAEKPLLNSKQRERLSITVYYGFGAGGGKSRASTEFVKFSRLCDPSQNGWLPECPQRHTETAERPPNPNALPV
jgi:hypothetical protein